MTDATFWSSWIGFSLLAPLVLVWARAQKWFPADRLKLFFAAGMWVFAATDVAASFVLGKAPPSLIGLPPWGWGSVGRGALIGVLGLALSGIVLTLTRKADTSSSREAMAKLAALPVWTRVLVLITVAVTEEMLFRVFPIGAASFADLPVAFVAVLGLAAFLAAHIQWSRSHMLFVAIVGGFLTIAFVMTRDPWANMIGHAIIDLPPVLLAGSMLSKMRLAEPIRT